MLLFVHVLEFLQHGRVILTGGNRHGTGDGGWNIPTSQNWESQLPNGRNFTKLTSTSYLHKHDLQYVKKPLQ